MYKVSFTDKVIAEDYISGLMKSGMICVRIIDDVSEHCFCAIENDVYFMLKK